MRSTRTAVLLFSLTAAVAVAQPDPWTIPAPDGAALLMALDQSDHTYVVTQREAVPKEAKAPDRVKLEASRDDRKAMDRCRLLVQEGKHDEAEETIAAMLATNPANYDALVLRARSLLAQEKHDQAIAALRDSLIGNRRNPEAWKVLGDVAAAAGKQVKRPKLRLQGWIRELEGGDVEVGSADRTDDLKNFPWLYYSCARAFYRYEGKFRRDFPGEKYRFTFREQVYAVNAVAQMAAKAKKGGDKIGKELETLLREQRRKRLVEFAFFAMYPEVIPAKPEKHFDALRPRLEKYFDTQIVTR